MKLKKSKVLFSINPLMPGGNKKSHIATKHETPSEPTCHVLSPYLMKNINYQLSLSNTQKLKVIVCL